MSGGSTAIPRTVAELDWEAWQPVDRATLLFVVCDGKILLIRKKRGLGAGKVNGPGGRIDPGETALEGAIREVREELGVEALDPTEHGDLSFQFLDGHSIHVRVFRAEACDGEPIETDEAIPLWTPLDAIPYDEMWEDDRHWLPHFLEGRRVEGKFIFDDDKMLDHELVVE